MEHPVRLRDINWPALLVDTGKLVGRTVAILLGLVAAGGMLGALSHWYPRIGITVTAVIVVAAIVVPGLLSVIRHIVSDEKRGAKYRRAIRSN
ncbi:MAG: hypothetical protein J0M00_03455 [Burkholderiales bacterium]|nr:hypothetical protein [Burkholderiales bacterium]